MKQRKKVIGIVGGMGPQAGADLFNNIISQTNAQKDQDHLSVILMSFPGNLTDRTAFLEGRALINPAYEIAEVIRKLEMVGAELIGIACNTSHSPLIFDAIVDEMQKTNCKAKLINMPAVTCEFISDNIYLARKVGVMTTNGTYQSGVYADMLNQSGYEVILPDFDFQNDIIHKMIYDPGFGIKATSGQLSKPLKSLLNKSISYFKERKADTIILGCTELSIIIKEKEIEGMTIVDSNKVMAVRLVQEAMRGEKSGRFEITR